MFDQVDHTETLKEVPVERATWMLLLVGLRARMSVRPSPLKSPRRISTTPTGIEPQFDVVALAPVPEATHHSPAVFTAASDAPDRLTFPNSTPVVPLLAEKNSVPFALTSRHTSEPVTPG